MIHVVRRVIPVLLLVLSPLVSRAQFLDKLHGGSLSVGATGQFSPQLTSNTSVTTVNVPFGPSGLSTYPETVTNQRQGTTDSLGFVISLQFHPIVWAGVELNYGFNHYSERFSFNYSTPPSSQRINIPTDAHEFTAAYSFHPRHIPFQPFLNVGGGAIDFTPWNASNQWRGAGLAELGFDMPTHSKHIGFRIEGRSLFYRAPNFYSTAISTRSWRVTVEPSISTYFRF